MKDKNFGGFLFVLLVIAFMCGLLAMNNATEFHKTPVSREAVDAIARDQARAQIARDNESARNNETIKFLALAVVTMAATLLVVPMSFMMIARSASAWHQRHDRAPDSAGNYALLPNGHVMWNPNTGMQIGMQVSEEMVIALAGQRAMVHATQAAFGNGIERGEARSRQRRIGESPEPAPEGWTVTTQPEAPKPPPPEFVLVDDTGERKLIDEHAQI